MQTTVSNIRIVSNEPGQGIVTLDEASLDDVSGGVAPLIIAGVAAGAFGVGVGAAIGVGYLANKLF
jgi:lactobin A/cerein 7B family class IIb bacteriocin